MTDQGAPEAPETEAREHDVFLRDDMAANPRDNLRREWVTMPEWGGKEVCVWQLTEREETNLLIAINPQERPNPVERQELTTAMRVVYSVRESDKPDAKQVFSLEDRDWILRQPNSAIRRIVEKGEELAGQRGATTEDMMAFFGILPLVVGCLTSTASASGACDDCPKKSSLKCPAVLCAELLPLTDFSSGLSADESVKSVVSA